MNWKNLTIGKKISLGFGIVIVLLVVLGALSFSGVGSIVKNASEVIDGKALDGELAQKEVDHLNWVGAVNKLLTDETVTQLDVETDHTQCGFGKWLYGDGRHQAEVLVPSLATRFKEIEEPHRQLHESALAIGKTFKQADMQLPALLAEREVDHLKWAAKIQEAFVQNHDSLGVQTDPTQCALGKWLGSDNARKAYESGDGEFKNIWDKMLVVHKDLHQSAIEIETHLSYGQVAQLNEQKKQLNLEFEQINTSLFALLKEVMATVIDPAKKQAELTKDVNEMSRWGGIDMVMNEQVISPFQETRLAMARFENEKTPEAWEKYQSRANKITAGLDAWHQLVKNEPILDKAAIQFTDLLQTWSGKAQAYQAVIMGAKTAENAIKTAVEIFNTQTMPLLDQTMSHLQGLKTRAEQNLVGMKQANQIYAEKTVPALAQVQTLLGELRKEVSLHILTDQAMLSAAAGTKRNVAIIAALAILSGILLAFIIARGIISVLSRITDGMGEGASQVASAANQVSSSSQSMAEGASQQAASIEETSSSMEEMSSMTKKNAENANHADKLMKEANKIVNTANESMGQLTRSMEDISKASEETSKIIKTIDEIAFQTNLLALNAAVEAARAGEAGAGFAVVADEVRNLAMRAADAAKNTAALIEGTVKKVNDGSALVSTTSDAFSKVARSSVKVGEIVAEISQASKEQSNGIEQVNVAITEMDKVVQQNAANAEESASASEEMSAQAEQLRDYVGELILLVTGNKNPGNGNGHQPRIKTVSHGSGKRLAGKSKMLGHRPKEVRPDQVIPFDDDENFENF
ncbi:MAG: CZB domain-containing protein [Proteobacteria bacterium]|nr:CZB domain-containing protein [Pseudomonadota bacterium]